MTSGELTVSLKKQQPQVHDEMKDQLTAEDIASKNPLDRKAAISYEITSSSNINKVSKLPSPEKKAGEKLLLLSCAK